MLHSTTFLIPCTKSIHFTTLKKYEKEYASLSQLSESRERLSRSLQNSREPEFLKDAFERYLSLLPDCAKLIESSQNYSNTNERYQWQSTLTGSTKFYSGSFFAFEVAMALTAYATLKLCLAEQDFASEEEQKINQVSRYLCEAAGIYEYLQSNILPECLIQASIPTPPDIHPHGAAFMNRLALGLAQEKVIHKAQLKCSSETTLLKLCNAAVQMFTQALARVSSVQGCESVASNILKFAEYHLLMSKAMSCFYLGKVSHSRMEHGLKVTCLRYCCDIFKSKEIQKLLGKFPFTQWTCSQQKLSIEASQLYEQYQRQNSMVYHQREPDWNTIRFEAERLLVGSIPFVLSDSGSTSISQRLAELRVQEPKKSLMEKSKSRDVQSEERKCKNSQNRQLNIAKCNVVLSIWSEFYMDEATLQCSNLENGTNIKETVKRIKNLCVGHPAEKTEYIQKGIVAALLKLIDPTDAELTWQICGTIGILANKNLAGAQQVVSNSGLSTLLSLLSCNQERIVKQASQCILVALKSIDDPVQVFRENMQLLETVSGLFCSSLASTSVTECTSFVLTRCLETVDFDSVVDWSRISTVCIDNIKSSTLRDSTDLVPYLTVLKTLTARLREVGIQLIDYNIVEILVELMKGVEMTVKILACKIYANLMHFNLLQEDQASKVTAVLIMPLLHRMLSKNERNVQLEGCKMLSEVASIGEIYQRQAFDCNLVHDLIELGRYISVADVEAASILLQAVAAVCSLVEDCRRLIFESRLFALVVSSLDASHSELKIAGLSALRSLSRSVRNLRTSLAEASLMEPLLKSLSDENKQVQVQALSTICNLVLYFSPLKNLFLESNGLTKLLNLCHSNDKSLKYYAIWALKNLLFLSGSKMKKRIIDEFGMDYIFCLIEKGEDYSLQEQGMNLLRNLTCTFSIESEQEIVLDFIEEHCYRLVLCIQDSLQSPSMEVVLQSLYVVCNFVVGNERHKQAICNSKVPKLLLHFLTDSNYQIRIAAIWCVINLVWKETNDICDFPNLSDCRKARIASLIEMGFEETLERLLTDSNVEVRGRAETALQLLRDRTLLESAGENEFEQISRSILL